MRGNRDLQPLDEALIRIFSAEAWNNVGTTCRLAVASFRMKEDDLAEAMGELMDDSPEALSEIILARDGHRKILQRALALLREADRRDNRAFDIALAARGI